MQAYLISCMFSGSSSYSDIPTNKFNPLSAMRQLVQLAVISWKKARHFAIYFVYFSSCKTTPLPGSWKHPNKYQRKVKAFTFEGLA